MTNVGAMQLKEIAGEYKLFIYDGVTWNEVPKLSPEELGKIDAEIMQAIAEGKIR
jgi:hypothetical protein